MNTSTFICHLPRRPYWAAGRLFPHSRRGLRKGPGVGYFFMGGSMPTKNEITDNELARLHAEWVERKEGRSVQSAISMRDMIFWADTMARKGAVYSGHVAQ